MNETTLDGVEPSPPRFWSPWATAGWGLLIMMVFIVVQIVVVIAWSMAKLAGGDGFEPEVFAAELATNGNIQVFGTLASAIACGLLVVVLSLARKGSQPGTSLALVLPSGAALARWLALTALLIGVSDGLTTILGKPVVPEFMTDLVASVSFPPLLWAAVVVASPLFEELFFRGFLIAGLRRGSLGDAGAIVLTSVVWASIHIQYGLYEITTIFIFGLVLGRARIGSRSLWVPIAMHMTANLVATIEAYFVLGAPG
jgi:hypothetical protein